MALPEDGANKSRKASDY